MTTFDVPGSSGTAALGINTAGTVTGYYFDASGSHGFMRTENGEITTFDAPGSGMGTNQGTFSERINTAGVITGYYADASGVAHGFVLIP